jgi:hypothetical protein
MQWEKLERRDPNTNPTSLYLIFQLTTMCGETDCPFGIITDGQQSAILDYGRSNAEKSSFLVEVVATPVRAIIASFIHDVGRLSKLCGFDDSPSLVPCRGAIFESVEKTPQSIENTLRTERCFRDFDLFTMQRSKDV